MSQQSVYLQLQLCHTTNFDILKTFWWFRVGWHNLISLLLSVCYSRSNFSKIQIFWSLIGKKVDWFSQQNELNFWKMRWRYCKTGLLSLIHQRVQSVDLGFCSCLLVEISQDFESWIRSFASMTQFPKKRTIGQKKNVLKFFRKNQSF